MQLTEGVDINIYGKYLNSLLLFITPNISADSNSADAVLVTHEKWNRAVRTPFEGFISGVAICVQLNVG